MTQIVVIVNTVQIGIGAAQRCALCDYYIVVLYYTIILILVDPETSPISTILYYYCYACAYYLNITQLGRRRHAE